MAQSEKPLVLVVDDSEATCTLIEAILRREFITHAAHDGAAAIERLKTYRYAAILLDLKMPYSDGFTVLDFLKEKRHDDLRRTLIVTGMLTPRELTGIEAYPINGIVAKPFDVEQLLARVQQCARLKGDLPFSDVFCSGPAVILLLADLLRQRWM